MSVSSLEPIIFGSNFTITFHLSYRSPIKINHIEMSSPEAQLEKLILLTKSIPSVPQAIQTIQTFRKQISYNWINSISFEHRHRVMCTIWSTLFELAINENATIYVNVCSTIGALIYCIAPFYPHLLMRSFSAAATEIKTTSYASIAIISAFLNIVHSISPADVEQFVIDTPVLLHFGVDVSRFIRHLPKLIPLMEPLNIQFHQQLLLSLVISFGKDPNFYYVESICLLISLSPQNLVPLLKDLILKNSLNQCILALGPRIFNNDKIFEFFTEDDLVKFSSVALEVISNPSSALTDFENACNTLSALTERCSGEFLENLLQEIKKAKLQEYPKHFTRFLMLISSDFEELKINDDDKNGVKCAKISALTKYLQKNPTAEEIETILDMAIKASSYKINEITSLLIIMVNTCFQTFVKTNKKKVTFLLNQFLHNKHLSWVQNCELVKLIESIGSDLCHNLIENFDENVIVKLLSFAFSQYNELSDRAVKCLSNLIEFNNMDVFFNYLNEVNIFDEFLCERFIILINSLYKHFPRPIFAFYAPIVADLIKFFDTPNIAGCGFEFLRRSNYYSIPKSFFNECIDWIVRLYKSVTQKVSAIKSPLRKPELPFITNNMETDVVSVSLIEAKSQLRPLKSVLLYFMSIPNILDSRSIVLMEENLRLFPDMILSKAVDCLQLIPDRFSSTVAEVLNTTSSFKTAAACAEFLCFGNIEYRLKTVDSVRFLIQNQKVKSGALIFSFYRFLNFANVDEASELLEKAKERLGIVALATLDAKLCLSDQTQFEAFSSKTKFSHWPINDADFCHFFESNEFATATITEYDDIDDGHWKFIFDHKDRFNLVNFDEYKANNFHKLSQYVKFAPEPIYVHQQVERIKKMSITQHVIDEEFVFDPSLALNFFAYSNVLMDQKLFDQYFKESAKSQNSELIYFAIDYATRNHLKYDKSLLIENKVYEAKHEKLIKLLSTIFDKSDVPFDESMSIDDITVNFYDKRNLIISVHFEEYMEKAFGNIHYSSKQFVKLAFFMANMKYSKDLISKYVSKAVDAMDQWDHSKKLISFLRLVTNLSMRTSNSELINFVSPLFQSESAAVINELSHLLYEVLLNIEVSPILYQLCRSCVDNYHAISPFLKVVTLIASFSQNRSIENITKAMVNSQLNNDLKIPSLILNGFRLMATFLNEKSNAWKLFYDTSDYFFDTLIINLDKPIFDEAIEHAMYLLIHRPEIERYDSYYKPKIIHYAFYVEPNSPSLKSHMRIIQAFQHHIGSPSPQYQSFMHKFVISSIPDPNLFDILINFAKWAISKCYIDDEFGMLATKVAEKYVYYFPWQQKMQIFAELLKLPSVPIETAFTQIWRVYCHGTPFLNVFLLLLYYVRQCTTEEAQLCDDVILSFCNNEKDGKIINIMHCIMAGESKRILMLM
ncbi:hypothetical protein TRFO_04734 [Tritrichomonas foetus]|uniref:Uncharacterized protein n=1 Tax=Tritrichomonas foetus TaxID=1144522 RepID=A0A1J4KH54_9EUKA|nr:hypothetical protein TRFO_04734 [Tritrichomonas foetus]|eukprot:OHT08677.1 hypothetical protein TRFO_04734 [Tritrichomonas foetus]